MISTQNKNTVPSAKTHYTLDGTQPTVKSPVYKTPLKILLAKDVELKAATILSNGNKSHTVSSNLKRREFKSTNPKKLETGLDYGFYHGPFKSYKEIKGKPTFRKKHTGW